MLARMKTLETDIEVSADGSLRLLTPLPSWLRPGRAHVLLVTADDNVSSDDASPAGIEKTWNVCGGDACIASTRVPVWTLEQSRRLGMDEKQLLEAYPSLTPRDLAAAWAYANNHGEEIDRAIRDNEAA